MSIIKNPLEDLQLRIAIINSNEDLTALSQAKTAINNAVIDMTSDLEKHRSGDIFIRSDVRDTFEYHVETLNEAYAKVDKVFQKLLKEVASKGENDGRTEK